MAEKRSLPQRQQCTLVDAATQSDDASNGQPKSATGEHADAHLASLHLPGGLCKRTKQRAAMAFDGRVLLVSAAAHARCHYQGLGQVVIFNTLLVAGRPVRDSLAPEPPVSAAPGL